MAIDTSYVGKTGAPLRRTWESKDALLYAVAVGAGQGDASAELKFTTENSAVQQRVLPSFICVAAGGPLPDGFSIDMTKMLHADMGFELFGDLDASGDVTSTASITGIFDKGSGALVSTATDVVDTASGELVARLQSGMFVRGEGGFGGERGPGDGWEQPDREPDVIITYETRPEQALLYRLTGDRNPLHSDPTFAARAGFPAPILHGMCTYGFTARALLHGIAGSDPSRFGSMHARFTKVVSLGETLTVRMWSEDSGARFQTLNSAGEVVLDRGSMTLR
ncbi:MaoC family dehydratase [Salinibacterium sp. SWN248]|uniref:MaoC family dehydratase n=1 Tax=Salinibacterium sp. SWN248 TaxID=2792056 RepID=UPI0018CD7DB4|nr:MaoC family dehydratase [Salinibacterium sp. SWN248]MBH0024819.1 MaoC family dehydratase N-terminal domain-containing protein [Salinibacterium sp. SWN248]